MRIASLLILLTLLFSCGQVSSNKNQQNFECDIRFGHKYYRIVIDEKGVGRVDTGRSTLDTEPFKIESSDSSRSFKMDSVNVLFSKLMKFKNQPLIDEAITDAPRAEMFIDSFKVYDTHRWDAEFWQIVKPIAKKLPSGFNPFMAGAFD